MQSPLGHPLRREMAGLVEGKAGLVSFVTGIAMPVYAGSTAGVSLR